MSWVEDARKLMQDFIAPELRAISAQIHGVHQEIAASNKLSNDRYLALSEKMDGLRREISLQIELALANRKLEELQARQLGSMQQPAAGQ
jgi:hypothetical protein